MTVLLVGQVACADAVGTGTGDAATGNDGFAAQTEHPTEIDAGNFALTTDMTSLEGDLGALEEELGESRRRTVTEMMENANRAERPLSGCNEDAYQPVVDQAGGGLQGFCWNTGDDETGYWRTQGTTTTRDATAEGTYDGQQLVATSWYHRPDDDPSTNVNKGVRITFNPFETDGAPGRYRHVLLVEPSGDDDGDASYDPVDIHAGGIFWYENLLYVADTARGFRIFDMDRLYAVETGDSDAMGRQPDGSYHAFNYALILPQVGWARNDGESLNYSFTALDRSSSPHSFVAGEFADPDDDDPGNNWLVRYPLDESSGLPAVEPDQDQTFGSEAYDTGFWKMQGAVPQDDRWWFASSDERGDGPAGKYGFLRVWDRGEDTVRTYDWAYGPEDLSYWPDPDGDDLVWTNTEFSNHRSVFGAPVDAFT